MISSRTKKAIFHASLGLIAVVIGFVSWVGYSLRLPYQTLTINNTKLYVPWEYISQTPATNHSPNTLEILAIFLSRLQEKHRFSTNMQALLASTAATPPFRESPYLQTYVIWTLEPLPSTQKLAPAHGYKPNTHTSIHLVKDGLYKIYDDDADDDTFSITNQMHDTEMSGKTVEMPGSWTAHCVQYKALKEGNSWGKCRRQLALEDMLLTFYFDGMLIEETQVLTTKILKKINMWQQKPQN